jgi:argininosuccinate lyase
MHTPWLVFIESNTTGTGRLFAHVAARQGYDPVLLTNDETRYRYAREYGLRIIRIDTQDIEAVLNACRDLIKERELAGITSTSEYYMEIAGEVAGRLARPGPDPQAIRACRNKHAQRIRLRQAGVSIPKFISVDSTEAAVEAAESLGLPVVLKPVSGSGSVGVKMCECLDEVQSHASLLLGQKQNERGLPLPGLILVEEMVSGPEYSVEVFGKRVIGITQKHLGPLPHFVEVGHDFPATLPDETESAINNTVVRALGAVGLGWGPSHCELRVTGGGVKIIEINPRLAGGYIPELVRLAFGIDMIAETIKLVVGHQPSLKKTKSAYSSIRFIIPDKEGTLIRVDNLDNAARLSGIVEARLYSSVRDVIHRHDDFRSRVGHVIAVAGSAETSRAAAEEARGMIGLVIEAESGGTSSEAN